MEVFMLVDLAHSVAISVALFERPPPRAIPLFSGEWLLATACTAYVVVDLVAAAAIADDWI